MSVTLRKRVNKDGSISLLLDIYHNGQRRYEFLKELKLNKATNPLDRQVNKSNLELAQRIRALRAQELASGDYAVVSDAGRKTLVVDWMQNYIDGYKKKDIRNVIGVFNRFKNFLNEREIHNLTFTRVTELLISDFQEYLQEHNKGEGAASYFNRFKKMLKHAHRSKMINVNLAAEVKTKQGAAKKRQILTLEEIQALARTPISNTQIRNAFLFSCLTGLRWIDVKSLKWENIDLRSRRITVLQSKTGAEVVINLNSAATKLLGDEKSAETLAFNLPSPNGANKALKAWVERSGIKKKITWHNARHSFGTNLIYHGTDVTTASSLLGHTSLKHTHRYVKVANELKEKATDLLNVDL